MTVNLLPSTDCKNNKYKKGVTRQGHFAGSQRRQVNQHGVGIISHYMLKDISRMKSEHMWTDGLMCSEDDLPTN